MRVVKAVILLILLTCPWTLCRGQVSFSSVGGERGYAAMRGHAKLDLDNGFVLLPSVGYYRRSDSDEDQEEASMKVAFSTRYEITDNFSIVGGASYVPRRMGFKSVSYGLGGHYELCYRCLGLKKPFIEGTIGQRRYNIQAYSNGSYRPNAFKTFSTAASMMTGAEWKNFFLQARYDKVIKYSDNPPQGVDSNWTDIPFMTAVVRGFVRDVAAARLSYRTPWVTPYAVYARYKYLDNSDYTVSVAGGVSVRWDRSTISGGVEVFEQNHRASRKTYFSLEASTEF